MNRRKFTTKHIFALIFILGLLFYLLSDNVQIKNNSRKIQGNFAYKSPKSFNEAIDFDYDSVYIFRPYIGAVQIEGIIGIKSGHIKQSLSENMVNMYVVKDGYILAALLGSDFYIDLAGKDYIRIDFDTPHTLKKTADKFYKVNLL